MISRNQRGDLEQRASMHEKPSKFFKRAAIVGSLAASLLTFTGCTVTNPNGTTSQVEPWQVPFRVVGGFVGETVRGGVNGYNGGNEVQNQSAPKPNLFFYSGVWNDINGNGKIDAEEIEQKNTVLPTEKAGSFIKNTSRMSELFRYEVINEQGTKVLSGNAGCGFGYEERPTFTGFTLNNPPVGKYTINWFIKPNRFAASVNLNIVNDLRESDKSVIMDIFPARWNDKNNNNQPELDELEKTDTFSVGELAGMFITNPSTHNFEFDCVIKDYQGNIFEKSKVFVRRSPVVGVPHATGWICSTNFQAGKYSFNFYYNPQSPPVVKELNITSK